MIHIFIGTKAQLIKMAPIMKELQNRSIEYNFIHSGQHQATFKEILGNFEIEKEPDVKLYDGEDITGIFQMGKWGRDILSRYGNKASLNTLFKGDQSGIALNHGDTFSTLLGSYLAKKQGLKSGHVESGLRSYNIFHPFPEELTRLLTFRLSDFYFAPGNWAMENLRKCEGEKINTCHNTLYDSLHLSQRLPAASPGEKFALISLHRFENIFFKRKLQKIIASLIAQNDGIKKLFILHKPTEKKLREFDLYELLRESGTIELRPRYDYFTFMSLVRQSEYLITDGGSNQEECFYLGKPCLLMRKATERQEGLDQNIILGKYDEGLLHHFASHYKEFERPPLILETSPTKIIVDTLLHRNFHR